MIASVRVHRFIKINVRKSTRTCNPTNSRSATSSGTRSLNLSSMKFNPSPVVLSVFGLLCVGQQIQAARILALVPTPSYSHQIPYRRLWLELHKRGHELVLVTSNPIPNMDPKTFQQIDISEAYKDIREVDFMHLRFDKVEWLAFVEEYLFSMAHVFVEHVLNHTDMKPIYAPNSNRKFDVVMAEMLAMPAIYAFAHRFDAPLIGMSSLGMLSINEHALGGLVLPSHEYTWEMEANVGTNQPFWRRLQNYIKLSRLLYVMYRDLFPRQQNLAEHYFGPLPPLLDILKNTSVVFVNQADAITPARPKLANMITFTSFHVEKTPTPLPADLQRFLDNATEGFIYLSLGSNAMSSSMPKKTLGVFLEVFARLPYKVVWKFEKDMPNKPDNIYTGKWLPQQSILAHPNIKLFIYQGGLQSSEEAIHFSVPLLGFPVLADQDYQVLRMEALGVAKYMDIVTITREELETTIKEMITNKEYKDKIIALKELVNDTPYDMVEYLAWWVEYVIRNKGASHLRSKLAHQPWYQRCDMDIVVFLTIVSVLIISSITSIIAKITVQWYKYYQMISPPGKQKIRYKPISERKSTDKCDPTISSSATNASNGLLKLGTMKFPLPPVVLSTAVLLCISHEVQPARILALVPTPSYSHQIPYRRLWLELHKRGHELVLVTSNPIPNMDPKTFQQIDISEAYKDIREVDFMHLRFDKVEWLAFVEEYLFSMAHVFVEHVLNHTDMKPIYAPNSNRKFDVVMAEMLAMPAIYAFAHRFDAPLIGMSSLGMLSINEHALGGLVLPSHEYTWEMEANVGTNQPFWRRLQNYIKLSRLLYVMYRDLFPRQQNLAEHYFGPLPPLLDILKNTSVVFVNQADAITPARPKLANMITFTSFHVEKTPTPLPADLQLFLDNATEGFIYFSLGSNVMSSSMPKETLQIFLDVFSKLPYKVVWKFEKDMPNKPDNIFTGKWLPQQSILAHPNIKLFIYQGGLQSSEEAVHFSVPLIGLPILADQDYQVLRMDALGVAKYMDVVTITREELEATIREIITNKEYKEKIIALKELVNVTPYNMVEYLAWWVEYVIRNKGAPHLRSSLAHQPWYQRCDMDIVVFLTIVSVLIILSITSIIVKMAVRWYNYYHRISPHSKQKIK
nr:uncharacterized protein LOC117224687 [Megalopta genalis]